MEVSSVRNMKKRLQRKKRLMGSSSKTKKPRFFKVLIDEDSLVRLCMPPDFLYHVIGELTSYVLLKTNSQKFWPVQLSITVEGHIFFEKGWKEFAKYHKLQLEECLVFTHSRKNYFRVTIFAATGYEREAILEELKPQEAKEKANNGSLKSRKYVATYAGRDKTPVLALQNECSDLKKLNVIRSEDCSSPIIEISDEEAR